MHISTKRPIIYSNAIGTIKVDASGDIPTQSSKSEEWINWHKELKDNFGKKQANALFVKAWKTRGTSSSNTNDLRTYLGKNGIVIDKSAWDSIVDKGAGIEDFFGSAFNVGKVIGISIAVIVVGGLGMIIFNIGKRPAESIGTAIKYAK